MTFTSGSDTPSCRGFTVLEKPWSPHIFYFMWDFVTRYFLQDGVVSTTPNPQPGGPVDYTQSGSYPLTSLALVTLLGTYASAIIALGVIRARKPPHPKHVLLQGGSPRGGTSATKTTWQLHETCIYR
jgi:hypothetical protein